MKATTPLMTVSTRSVRPVIERLRALEIDVAAVLTAAGCDAAALDDPDGRIPHQLAIAVWREAVERSGDDTFGIHTAEQIRPGAFDVLDYATRSSATLGEGLQRLLRYHRILHDVAVVQLSEDGDRVELTHELPDQAGVLPRQPAEFIVAAWIVVARQATGTDFAPLEVTFRHSPPADTTEHERFFRAAVRFNSAANGVVLSRSLLELPLIKSDPGLCAVLERHLGELLDRMPRTTSVSARVRQAVAKDLSTAPPSATAAARKLHMSRRTLQRLLEAEGTTFSELVDTLRCDLATRYLREPAIAIAEVAFLLGFSEASAFHRAFKRWQGTTPAGYRAKLR
jgi:AraC-like DNA-binding protein